MKDVRLSIITINLNNAAGLRKTIESVINQTSDEFEYLVIDGGSTDGSVEVIREYEVHLDYWESEPDRGIFHAMNKGIARAKGEYCQFLNSGDRLSDPNVTKNMLASLNGGETIVVGNVMKELTNGKLYRDKGAASQKVTMLTFFKSTVNHSSAYIKRSLFEVYGLYDEKLKIVSDWKWYLVVIGLNGEQVSYRNIDVTLFDLNGISSINTSLEELERKNVLKELIPSTILADYSDHWRNIYQARRINRYRPTKALFWFIDRVLNKWENHR